MFFEIQLRQETRFMQMEINDPIEFKAKVWKDAYYTEVLTGTPM